MLQYDYKLLKPARLRAKLTQTQVARACDTTSRTIAKFENNKISPSLSRLAQLADALGVHPGDLFSEMAQQITAAEAE